MDVVPEQPIIVERHNLWHRPGGWHHARLGLLLGSGPGRDEQDSREK